MILSYRGQGCPFCLVTPLRVFERKFGKSVHSRQYLQRRSAREVMSARKSLGAVTAPLRIATFKRWRKRFYSTPVSTFTYALHYIYMYHFEEAILIHNVLVEVEAEVSWAMHTVVVGLKLLLTHEWKALYL